MTVMEVMSTGEPDTREVVDRVMVPPPPVTVQSPSMTVAAPEDFARNHPAVPVAVAFTDAGSGIVTTPEAALTSSRRWQQRGMLSTFLRHQLILAGYAFGISPQRLAGWR